MFFPLLTGVANSPSRLARGSEQAASRRAAEQPLALNGERPPRRAGGQASDTSPDSDVDDPPASNRQGAGSGTAAADGAVAAAPRRQPQQHREGDEDGKGLRGFGESRASKPVGSSGRVSAVGHEKRDQRPRQGGGGGHTEKGVGGDQGAAPPTSSKCRRRRPQRVEVPAAGKVGGRA